MPKRRMIGDKNCIGQTVVKLRKQAGWKQNVLLAKLQTCGIDVNQSSLSDLEGQKREANDRELKALAEIFGVTIEELYNPEEKE